MAKYDIEVTSWSGQRLEKQIDLDGVRLMRVVTEWIDCLDDKNESINFTVTRTNY